MRSVHVAFLRGVNVGGKHSLPMTALAALFTESGCGDVRTYIQSGNVQADDLAAFRAIRSEPRSRRLLS